MVRMLGDGFAGMSSGQIALLVAAGAIIFVVVNWRRNSVRRKNQPAETMMTANPLSVREVTTEVEALLGELEETSRRLAAQLDNRYTRLEQLLAEADERIKRLEELAGGNDAGTRGRGDGARGDGESPRISQIGQIDGGKVEKVQTAVSAAQRTLTRLRAERGAPPAGEDPAYVPIYALADRGKTSREIAQELGRQPGEIELILALRQRG
jgi:hypothetical protein